MYVSKIGEKAMGPQDRKVWENIVRLDPSSPALLPLARFYLKRKKPELAMKITMRVRAAHPYLLEADLLSAQALLDQNRRDEAVKILGHAIEGFDVLAGIFQETASLLNELDQPEDARRADDAGRALAAAPPGAAGPELFFDSEAADAEPSDEAVPTETLAELYLAQGHVDQAIAIYRKLLNENPNNEKYRTRLLNLTEDKTAEPPGEQTPTVQNIEAQSIEIVADHPKARLAQRLEKLKSAAKKRRQAVESASS